MHNDLKALLSKADYLSSHLDVQQNIFDLEGVIAEISELNDPSVIAPLLLLIRDSMSSDEIVFSIIHYVESFDDEIYVRNVIACLNALYKAAPSWCGVILLRIINNDDTAKTLTAQIKEKALFEWDIIKHILDDLVKRFPSASERVKSSTLYSLSQNYF
jgi:hypothetical protein